MLTKTTALWFFVALFGGGTGVFLTKLLSDEPWHAAIVAAGVVLALTIYYILNDEDAPEEEGDNVYYLGLLFTLISLMISLLESFDGIVEGDEISKGAILALLENFGIALISTIFGIAGRVAVQNWQRTSTADRARFPDGLPKRHLPPVGADPGDLERFNRHLLGRIASDLTQGANALARFHRIVRGHASETDDFLSNHGKTLVRESIEFRDTLQQNAASFSEDLKAQSTDAVATVADSLRVLVDQVDVMAKRQQEASEKCLKEIRDVTQSYRDEISALNSQSLDALRENFETAASKAVSLSEHVQSSHDSYLGEIRDATRSNREEVRSTSDELVRTVQESLNLMVQQANTAVQGISDASNLLRSEFDRLKAGLGEASSAGVELGDSVQKVAKVTTVLESDVDRLRETLQSVNSGTEAMKTTVSTLVELDTMVRAGRDTVESASALRSIANAMRKVSEEGSDVAEKAADAAKSLKSLTEDVKVTISEAGVAADALRLLTIEAQQQTKALRRDRGLLSGIFGQRR